MVAAPIEVLSPSSAVIIAFFTFIYLKSVADWRTRSRGRPFPPGPKPLPFVGNFFDMAKHRPWLSYRDLGAKYGDLIHFRALGQSLVVLGSVSAIFEYLDKRSANTSDRPQTPMIELTGSSLSLSFMPYGQRWRRYRRTFWQHFHREASFHHRPVQVTFSHRFLGKLLDDPSQFTRHIRYTFVGSVMKIMYGIDIDKEAEDYIAISDNAIEGPAHGLVPGRFLVEFLPFLKYVPTWFPGAYSQRLFSQWMTDANILVETPYNRVKMLLKQRTESSEPPRSIIAQQLLDVKSKVHSSLEQQEVETMLKGVGMVSIEAGGDTTFGTLQSMFLAMALHPDVVKKAQAELDAVVGPHRLPTFDDRDSLVYINAVVKESLRWHNVVPLGLAHSTTQDDEFRGYFIPAGTILVPNIWACMHDPEVYDDPYVFRPERFIRDGKLDTTGSVHDPSSFAFGFGRRICPGRHFADAGMFINMASVLHVFHISPPLGPNGLPIQMQHTVTDGFSSYPEDCRCTIKPRSAQAEALIRVHALAASRGEGEL